VNIEVMLTGGRRGALRLGVLPTNRRDGPAL